MKILSKDRQYFKLQSKFSRPISMKSTYPEVGRSSNLNISENVNIWFYYHMCKLKSN